ncbi:hypothetical protein SUGI_0890170 [Cryptomeria japonica]|nr:hypothetical protein SUGI_0890170 [Cryptomeria japonica]
MAPCQGPWRPAGTMAPCQGPWRPCQGPWRPGGTMAPHRDHGALGGPRSAFEACIRSRKSQTCEKSKVKRSVNSPRPVARRRSGPGAGSRSSWDAPVVVKAW